MRKKLSEMSLEELWQLFPIFLVEHHDYWKEWYLEEEKILKNALSHIERIIHIGSTAISCIWQNPLLIFLWKFQRETI